MYTRGSASDYDDWNTEGWAFKDLLPLARKVSLGTWSLNKQFILTHCSMKTETYHLRNQEPKLHGKEGPLNVTYGG